MSSVCALWIHTRHSVQRSKWEQNVINVGLWFVVLVFKNLVFQTRVNIFQNDEMEKNPKKPYGSNTFVDQVSERARENTNNKTIVDIASTS